MEFFPNNTTTLSQQITVTNGGGATTTNNDSSERFLAGILDTFPLWAATGNEVHSNGPSVLGNVNVGLGPGNMHSIVDGTMPENHTSNIKTSPDSDFFLSSFMAGLDSLTSTATAAAATAIINNNNGNINITNNNINIHNNINNNNVRNNLGPIGCVRSNKMSPESNNSSTGIICSWCDITASMRCVDCNEFMCNDCIREHRNSSLSSNHSIISLPTPIGTSPTTGIISMTTNNTIHMPTNLTSTNTSYICDLHNEVLRYVCDYCKKLVCQCCTLHEHKEHSYASIQSFVDEAQHKIDAALESSRMGTKCIKSSIDKALSFIRLIERNCSELTENIRKAFRQFILAIEDRERYMLDFVEKLRQRRLTTLHDQMAGLKSALSGLAETSEMLQKVYEQNDNLDHIDVAMKVTNGQRQLEQFAAIYKDLQPKHEIFVFVAPDYGLLQDLRNQGAVILLDEKNIPVVACGGINTSDVPAVTNTTLHGNTNGNIVPASVTAASAIPAPAVSSVTLNTRRPLLRDNCYRLTSPSTYSRGGSACAVRTSGVDWELSAMRNSPGLHFGAPRSTQAIPGSAEHVKTRKSNALSLSFATEGHEDGQVSRPWGLCVDKLGNIFVSDRRNNRVQVFNVEGLLKFKFGRKGVGNGEFDLPAGICVDIDNRIIVVDKDNHRVQIFNGTGAFLLKFGSYGKEYGQFQYPWDVAVNSRRQIVVTDSRNHRIQQFDSEGRFIRQIVFDNHGQNKGIASPRGVCYTPTGNIIVSDFDNHCLYLIDPDINEILSAKGHEGSGYPEFNRPSGLCCDDDGRIIVADSKNQRIVVFSPCLDYLWDIEVRPSLNPLMPPTLDEKDRTCDVALMPDGRIVFLIELSPDSKEGSNPYKRFVHVF